MNHRSARNLIRLGLGALFLVSVCNIIEASPLQVASTDDESSTTSTTDTTKAKAADEAAGAKTDTSKSVSSNPSKSQGLGAASLSVADNLDLVTTSIWQGGTEFFSMTPSVFVTSTLPASKTTTGTNKYQDAEMLMPDGGVLNMLLSYGSVNIWTQADLSDAKTAAKNTTGSTTTLDRDGLSDRYYFNPIKEVIASDSAQMYLLDGIGARMVNRNLDATTASTASNYGISGVAYLGLGVDGKLLPIKGSKDPSGNYRVEAFLVESATDSVSADTLYPAPATPRTMNAGIGMNIQAVVEKKFNVNMRIGEPLGYSRRYVGKIILVGVTLNK